MLQEIPGVAAVTVVGGRAPVVNVTVHQSALAAYHLTLSQVLTALRAENTSGAGGAVTVGHQSLGTVTEGGYPTARALASLPVVSRPPQAVLLGQVATITPRAGPGQQLCDLERASGRGSRGDGRLRRQHPGHRQRHPLRSGETGAPATAGGPHHRHRRHHPVHPHRTP
ncbi:protein of unknown function [Candidatus Hydrogenisulfobacillus filiaventi]|uniref:Uncharacterized protein n=1 Tax=Candidatus Hydrogenisulfobacillus filiaventi TaxID=2707344 RepID=A0A6F8ZF26_9FIRM|nr:protein of unknown function [Candidatus Hydrogenisulfobacillus filiaventi]